jgi:Flp pilus assembly CpaF family ATPase
MYTLCRIEHETNYNLIMNNQSSLNSHLQSMLENQLVAILPHLRDELTQEVMINGENNVWVERAGEMVFLPDVKISEAEIRGAIDTVARLSDKEVKDGQESGVVDARMDGFRIAAAVNGISTMGSTICIRKHSSVVWTLDDYVNQGYMTEKTKDFLIEMVINRKNFLVSGGTSSGKTTFLNALISYIPQDERIITIEDTRELAVKVPNWVPLEANDQANITIRRLVKLALRYRPDRIIVGEIRGAEAFDFMRALNTGHDGGFGTMHANSALSALSTLETLILSTEGIDWPLESVRAQIGDTFDFVLQLVRDKGKRRLSEIMKLNHFDRERKCYVTESVI